MFEPANTDASGDRFRVATSMSGRDSLLGRVSQAETTADAHQLRRNADRDAGQRLHREAGQDFSSPSAQPVDPIEGAGSGGVPGDLARMASTGVKKRKARERSIPSTPLCRVMGFAGLGAGLAWGTFQESARRLWEGQGLAQPGQSALSPFLTEANAERLAVSLCRMRGAALKVGQMLSIQDESLVPLPVLQALERVRQGADVMPKRQLMKMISTELGPDWREQLQSFDDAPMAAASVGQVHRAVTKEGKEVAMKVQYPGVANSVDSDIENVKCLLDYTNLIPEGLYLDHAMRVRHKDQPIPLTIYSVGSC